MSRQKHAVDLNQKISDLIRSNNKLTKAHARAGGGYKDTKAVLEEILKNAKQAHTLITILDRTEA